MNESDAEQARAYSLLPVASTALLTAPMKCFSWFGPHKSPKNTAVTIPLYRWNWENHGHHNEAVPCNCFLDMESSREGALLRFCYHLCGKSLPECHEDHRLEVAYIFPLQEAKLTKKSIWRKQIKNTVFENKITQKTAGQGGGHSNTIRPSPDHKR